jgi:hypothetical protein
MEDWWLVRDAKGQTGWVYGRLLEVSAPETLLRYAEGQRIVGAYILANVEDPESGILNNGNPVTTIPEYITVMSPYKAGLPYDFNQVRLFIWNVKKHRYETGFSERNIVGYLPIKLGSTKDPYGKGADAAQVLPAFTYHVLAGDQTIPTPDPTTGLIKPGRTISKTYRLEGNIVRRILPPNVQPEAEAHPEAVVLKPGSKAFKKAALEAAKAAAKPIAKPAAKPPAKSPAKPAPKSASAKAVRHVTAKSKTPAPRKAKKATKPVPKHREG